MARDGNGTVGLDTKITVGTLVTLLGGLYWLINLEARVNAAEKEVDRVTQFQREIVARLDAIAEQQTSMSIDIGGIQARLDALIEWSDMKRKRTNSRP